VTETVAIIIFGAAVRPDGSPSPTLRRRVEAAFDFGQKQTSVLYIPTGAVGRFGPSEAQVMAGILKDLGVPNKNIQMEETGTDTLSSALACARLLHTHRGPVFVASSAYHLLRCVALLRLADCRAGACPPPPYPAAPGPFSRWYMRLRECAALPVDIISISLRKR
jgi:vancomycin permeability regulator SanA